MFSCTFVSCPGFRAHLLADFQLWVGNLQYFPPASENRRVILELLRRPRTVTSNASSNEAGSLSHYDTGALAEPRHTDDQVAITYSGFYPG